MRTALCKVTMWYNKKYVPQDHEARPTCKLPQSGHASMYRASDNSAGRGGTRVITFKQYHQG